MVNVNSYQQRAQWGEDELNTLVDKVMNPKTTSWKEVSTHLPDRTHVACKQRYSRYQRNHPNLPSLKKISEIWNKRLENDDTPISFSKKPDSSERKRKYSLEKSYRETRGRWGEKEIKSLIEAINNPHITSWSDVSANVSRVSTFRPADACRQFYDQYQKKNKDKDLPSLTTITKIWRQRINGQLPDSSFEKSNQSERKRKSELPDNRKLPISKRRKTRLSEEERKKLVSNFRKDHTDAYMELVLCGSEFSDNKWEEFAGELKISVKDCKEIFESIKMVDQYKQIS